MQILKYACIQYCIMIHYTIVHDILFAVPRFQALKYQLVQVGTNFGTVWLRVGGVRQHNNKHNDTVWSSCEHQPKTQTGLEDVSQHQGYYPSHISYCSVSQSSYLAPSVESIVSAMTLQGQQNSSYLSRPVQLSLTKATVCMGNAWEAHECSYQLEQ